MFVTLWAGFFVANAQPHTRPVSVVMLSDLHFDPYHDPAKLAALRTADAADWARILIMPESTTQDEDYKALQKTCHARGEDSSWHVVNSALQAARAEDPAPLFVTVSGDLLTHKFDCRMHALVPSATPEDVASFAQKTVEFLALQLRQTFPGVPVYLALGNNDSGCTDYHQSQGSDFVRTVATISASGFTKARDLKTVLKAFSDRGDYSVLLPSPMNNTRLIILQDVFESPEYRDCGGKPDAHATLDQIEWLRAQLIAAKSDHQHVWVMAHIPPGVDEFATFHRYVTSPEKMCEVKSPTLMLTSDALAHTLANFADIVRLAVFAHTHMDEIKLLRNGSGEGVPAKLVPSVSPVNGNNPAFTVAQVQPQSATLLDYTVYVANNPSAAGWTEEYRYSAAYKEPDFSAASVAQLTSALASDKEGDTDASLAYQKWFLPGDDGAYARGLHKIWPSYACATRADGETEFHNCMCSPGSAAETNASANGH